MILDSRAFQEFFTAVHTPEGSPPVVPYTWQLRLAEQVLTGTWPDAIHIPTGLGKTGAITAAVFAIAARADAPTRVIYVVDRRTVVDAAYDQARLVQERLRTAEPGSVLAEVADRLRERAGLFGEVLGSENELVVSRLRGGEPRDEDWFTSPVTPAVIIGTVDQIGSRLLHRGYGESPAMWPIHAALVGMDSLLLLDEPHLSVPFLETLAAVDKYQPTVDGARVQPAQTVVLGATLPQGIGPSAKTTVALDETDRQSPAVRRHLDVSKPLILALAKKDSVESLVDAAIVSGARHIAVMVNTVDKARNLWSSLRKTHDAELVIGRSRPVDRAEVEDRLRDLCGPQARPADASDTPVVVVATQTLEVGADLSFDTVISEAAPWPNLVQRAGRLLRRAEPHPGTFIVIPSPDPHPAYGEATKQTLSALKSWVAEAPHEADMGFHGIEAAQAAGRFGSACHPAVTHAPVMLSEHVRTWTRTSPVPVQDIPVAPFLHGVDDRADDVRIVWRRGVKELLKAGVPDNPTGAGAVWDDAAVGVDVLPCRAAETLEVPVGAARAFLRGLKDPHVTSDDVTPADDSGSWTRDPTPSKHFLVQTRDGWVRDVYRVKPGSTVVVDVSEGGLLPRQEGSSESTGFAGWDPRARHPVTDRSDGLVSSGLVRRRLSTFVADAEALGGSLAEELVAAQTALMRAETDDLSPSDARRARAEAASRVSSLVSESIGLLLPNDRFPGSWETRDGDIKPGWLRDGVPTDWVVICRSASTTGPKALVPQTIVEHGSQVAALARAGATMLAIADVEDLVHGALHHDDGKVRPEWQRSIGVSSPSPELSEALAKSGTDPSPWERRRARTMSSLETGWAHEALSASRLATDGASDLAVHLAGSHHGHGRPFYASNPAGRPEQQVQTAQADRFARLVSEHGPWGLALHETILRLSDWAASGHPTSPALLAATEAPKASATQPSPTQPSDVSDVRLSGLTASNLADYCTAVGLLRLLARVDPRTTLRWDGTVPILGWPQSTPADDPALLRTALDQLVLLRAEIASADPSAEITAGQSGVDEHRARQLAEAYRGTGADAEAWFSGAHDETIRQKGDITKVAGSAAAIWTMGRTSPWAQIDTACKDYVASQKPGRRAAAVNERINQIGAALLSTPGTLHMCREVDANTYGLDYRSGSYRAKADRDAGYVPFLVALAHLGFNTLYRPRTRTRTVNGSRNRAKDPMALELWLHTTPLTAEGIHAALSMARSPDWLGPTTQILRTTQVTTGNRATFYPQTRPAGEQP